MASTVYERDNCGGVAEWFIRALDLKSGRPGFGLHLNVSSIGYLVVPGSTPRSRCVSAQLVSAPRTTSLGFFILYIGHLFYSLPN